MNIDKDIGTQVHDKAPIDQLASWMMGEEAAKKLKRRQRYNAIVGQILASTITLSAIILIVAFVIWALRHLLG